MQYLSYLNSPEGTISFKSAYFPAQSPTANRFAFLTTVCTAQNTAVQNRTSQSRLCGPSGDNPHPLDQLAGSAIRLWLLPAN